MRVLKIAKTLIGVFGLPNFDIIIDAIIGVDSFYVYRIDIEYDIIIYCSVMEGIDKHAGFFTESVNGYQHYFFGNEEWTICCSEEGPLFRIRKEQKNYYAVIYRNYISSTSSAILFCLLLENAQKCMIGLHAVTMKYNDKIILLSAVSGTGKTTHSNLWVKEYSAEILNGDYAIVTAENDVSFFNGSPFSGSSNISINCKERITDVVFLEQAKYNMVQRLKYFPSIVKIVENCFLPSWSNELTRNVLDSVAQVVKSVKIWKLYCTPSVEAARTLHESIFGK